MRTWKIKRHIGTTTNIREVQPGQPSNINGINFLKKQQNLIQA